MTQTLATNINNDMVLTGANDVLMRSGQDALADITRAVMNTQINEAVYSWDRGMPMFATAFNTYNPVQFEAAARVILLRVPGVLAIESFTVDRVNNTLVYATTLRTIHGIVNVNG